MKKPLSHREIVISYLPFRCCFFLKNDFTVFKLVEKRFNDKEVIAEVLNHPELRKKFDFSELVYELSSDDIHVLKLLLKGFNG